MSQQDKESGGEDRFKKFPRTKARRDAQRQRFNLPPLRVPKLPGWVWATVLGAVGLFGLLGLLSSSSSTTEATSTLLGLITLIILVVGALAAGRWTLRRRTTKKRGEARIEVEAIPEAEEARPPPTRRRRPVWAPLAQDQFPNEEERPPEAPIEEETRPKRRTPTWIILGGALVVVVLLLILFQSMAAASSTEEAVTAFTGLLVIVGIVAVMGVVVWLAIRKRKSGGEGREFPRWIKIGGGIILFGLPLLILNLIPALIVDGLLALLVFTRRGKKERAIEGEHQPEHPEDFAKVGAYGLLLWLRSGWSWVIILILGYLLITIVGENPGMLILYLPGVIALTFLFDFLAWVGLAPEAWKRSWFYRKREKMVIGNDELTIDRDYPATWGWDDETTIIERGKVTSIVARNPGNFLTQILRIGPVTFDMEGDKSYATHIMRNPRAAARWLEVDHDRWKEEHKKED